MSEPAESPGLISSLRHVGSTLVGMVANRLELFVVELQERIRLLEVMTLMLLALLFGGFALALVTGSVVFLLWLIR